MSRIFPKKHKLKKAKAMSPIEGDFDIIAAD